MTHTHRGHLRGARGWRAATSMTTSTWPYCAPVRPQLRPWTCTSASAHIRSPQHLQIPSPEQCSQALRAAQPDTGPSDIRSHTDRRPAHGTPPRYCGYQHCKGRQCMEREDNNSGPFPSRRRAPACSSRAVLRPHLAKSAQRCAAPGVDTPCRARRVTPATASCDLHPGSPSRRMSCRRRPKARPLS
jgi:hypothetical protein